MWGRTLFEKQGIHQAIETCERETKDPSLWQNQRKAQELFLHLKQLKTLWEPLVHLSTEVQMLIALTEHARPGDLPSLEEEYKKLWNHWKQAELLLYLSGPYDHGNCYLSITAGAGGTEAQDWAAMLLRMYLRYCEGKKWTTAILDKTDGQEAGIKSVTLSVQGDPAYGYLKCERGTHRLVRLSPFNAKNLRQTSFALVEVLPELRDTEEITIDPKDVRIDTFRSGGAGGQKVNKTDSAVRITHNPTGVVVTCQNERSQQQNRTQAMKILQAKLLEQRQRREEEEKKSLKGATKSADFGQQIRSYVLHPYQLVKDLRTEVETSDTQGILDGTIQPFIDAELRLIEGVPPSKSPTQKAPHP